MKLCGLWEVVDGGVLRVAEGPSEGELPIPSRLVRKGERQEEEPPEDDSEPELQ